MLAGIGKAYARRLAGQGLNVVLVALDDDLLEATAKELSESYPKVSFRKVGVNLGRPGYLDVIRRATEDIDVQCVFCNAGYLLTGLFDSVALERHMENLECNATSAVQITHLFLQRMVGIGFRVCEIFTFLFCQHSVSQQQHNKGWCILTYFFNSLQLAKGLRGCFVYTSSAAAAIPNPFSALYASTKSFLSSFGASIAAEVKSSGIDVLVVHPSPVASRFYDKAHKLSALQFFQKLAVDAEELPDTVFASIGRLVWRDVGPTALGFRLLMKVLDYNLFATIIALTAPYTGDFKKYMKRDGGKARGKAQ